MNQLISFYKINITSEERNWATKKAKKDIENANKNQLISRFQTDEPINKIAGNIGEIAFSKWLRNHEYTYLWQNDVTGRSDDYDFLIHNKRVDVKTSIRNQPIQELNPETYKLLVNKKQAQNSKSDVFVWVILEGNNPEAWNESFIVGCMSKERLLGQEENVLNTGVFQVSVNNVLDVKELINII